MRLRINGTPGQHGFQNVSNRVSDLAKVGEYEKLIQDQKVIILTRVTGDI